MSPEEIADAIEEILEGKEGYKPGGVDWISVIGDEIERLMRR